MRRLHLVRKWNWALVALVALVAFVAYTLSHCSRDLMWHMRQNGDLFVDGLWCASMKMIHTTMISQVIHLLFAHKRKSATYDRLILLLSNTMRYAIIYILIWRATATDQKRNTKKQKQQPTTANQKMANGRVIPYSDEQATRVTVHELQQLS